jgi:2-keto-4-pentenoate hydratase
MIVMTGSTLATRFPKAGEQYRYEIEGLGSVSTALS